MNDDVMVPIIIETVNRAPCFALGAAIYDECKPGTTRAFHPELLFCVDE